MKNYMWPISETFKNNIDALSQCLEQYGHIFREYGIILFGAGIHGCEFLCLLQKWGWNVVKAFIDNNPDKIGGCINEFPIISLEEAIIQYKNVPIVISVESYSSIRKQLASKGLKEKIDYFCPIIDPYKEYINEFRRQCSNHILALGDCFFTAVSIEDENMTDMWTLLQSTWGKQKIKILGMHGMGMGGAYHILCHQLAMGIRPAHCIVEANLEFFMPRYHLLPRVQHVDLLRRIARIPGCDTPEYLSFVSQSAQRFEKFQTACMFTTSAKSIDSPDMRAKLYLQTMFLYQFNFSSENFIYYMKILNLLKQENITATVFIPPVNYELGEILFNGDFKQKYDINLVKLRDKTREAGFELLEMNYALTAKEFCTEKTPSEISNYSGRIKLLRLLSAEISSHVSFSPSIIY